MGRLGTTPVDGCAPLGEHLLGAWVIFAGALSLGATPTIDQQHTLGATDITAGTPTLEQPTIAHVVNLTADDITAGTPTLDQPTIARIVNLTAAEFFFAAWNLDTPTLFAYTTTPDDRTTIPILDPLSSTPPTAARQSTPDLATLSSAPPSAQRTSIPY